MFSKELWSADAGVNHNAARGGPLQFKDSQGRKWMVCEHECGDVPGRRGDRCLIFESEYSMRRVWSYPADWREMTAQALEELSWRR